MILDKHGQLVNLGDTFSFFVAGNVYLGELIVKDFKVLINWISGMNPFTGTSTALQTELCSVWHSGLECMVELTNSASEQMSLCVDKHGNDLYLNDSFEFYDPDNNYDGYIGTLKSYEYELWVEFSDGESDLRLDEYWDASTVTFTTKIDSTPLSSPSSMLISSGAVKFQNVI